MIPNTLEQLSYN